MKYIHFSRRRLDSRGVSHFVLPLAVLVLVAVGGTFALVAKRASNADLSSGAAATATAKKTTNTDSQRSYLVIYPEQGRYNKVKISLSNVSTGKSKKVYKCGGALSDAKPSITKNLPATKSADGKTTTYKPVKVSCDATSGSHQYKITVGKGTKYQEVQVVDIDPGYCTLVRWNKPQSAKTKVANGKCNTAAMSDAPEKTTPTLRVLPALTQSQKAIKGYVEVVPNSLDGNREAATRPMCAGQVLVKFTDASPSANTMDPLYSTTVKSSLRFVGTDKKTLPYCAAYIPTSKSNQFRSGHSYRVSAEFTGNVFMNSKTEASETVQAIK